MRLLLADDAVGCRGLRHTAVVLPQGWCALESIRLHRSSGGAPVRIILSIVHAAGLLPLSGRSGILLGRAVERVGG